MVSLGIRFRSDRQATHKNSAHYFHSLDHRNISTYFHAIEKFGLAQSHLAGIVDSLEENGFDEPHEIYVRLRAPMGDRKLLDEHLSEQKRVLETEGVTSSYRTFKNSDGSLDAEMKVDASEGFQDAFLALGETEWPKSI